MELVSRKSNLNSEILELEEKFNSEKSEKTEYIEVLKQKILDLQKTNTQRVEEVKYREVATNVSTEKHDVGTSTEVQHEVGTSTQEQQPDIYY